MWQPKTPAGHFHFEDAIVNLWLENVFRINFHCVSSEAMDQPTWRQILHCRITKEVVGAFHHRRSVWRDEWEWGESYFCLLKILVAPFLRTNHVGVQA